MGKRGGWEWLVSPGKKLTSRILQNTLGVLNLGFWGQTPTLDSVIPTRPRVHFQKTKQQNKNGSTCQIQWLEVRGLTRESFAEEVRLKRIRQAGRRAGCSGGGECGLARAKVCGRRVRRDCPVRRLRSRTGEPQGLRAPSAPSPPPAAPAFSRHPPPASPVQSPRWVRGQGREGVFLPPTSP